MKFSDFNRLARLGYRQSGEKLTLPDAPRTTTPGFVRLSALGKCPLQHAFQKTKQPYDLPHLDPNNNLASADTMDAGTYVALMYQEAWLWYARKHSGVHVTCELEAIDPVRKATGRIDAVIQLPDEPQWIAEIKFTHGEPRWEYCLQLLAYALLGDWHTHRQRLFLLTIGKTDSKTWELRPEGQGFVLYDEETELPYKGFFRDDFNTPERLNFDVVTAEIQRLHFYMKRWASLGKAVHPPISDPLNDKHRYWCVDIKEPTKTKVGYVEPACGWCPTCHGISGNTPVLEREGTLVIDAGF